MTEEEIDALMSDYRATVSRRVSAMVREVRTHPHLMDEANVVDWYAPYHQELVSLTSELEKRFKHKPKGE